MIKRKQDRYDELREQGIEDTDLADTIKQMKEQLAMLTLQKQQAVIPQGMGQQAGTPPGTPARPGVPR